MVATRGDVSLRSLEGLRFLSSLGIVAFHYIPYAAPLGRLKSLHLCVDLFFVISGIVLAITYGKSIRSKYQYIDFIKRRFARIYPLHVVTLLFYAAIGVLISFAGLNVVDAAKYNFAMLAPNILMVHAWIPHDIISFNYVSWSISAEMFVYILFPIFVAIVGRGMISGIAFIAAGLTASMMISGYLLGEYLTDLDWNFGILRAVPSFSLGVWLALYREKLIEFIPSGVALAGCYFSGMAILMLMAVEAHPYAILPAIYVLVAAALVCDLKNVGTLMSWHQLSSRGALTYSIYMLHTVMATVLLSFVLPRVLGQSQQAVLVSILIAAVATYVGAVFSYRLFEMPMRKWINSLRFKRTEAARP